MNHSTFRRRSLAVAALLVLTVVLFLGLLYDAQINHGIDIDASTAANTITTRETVEAARGAVTDRYGRVLVNDQTVYHVRLDLGAMGDLDAQRATLRRLVELCRQRQIPWNGEELPMEMEQGQWVYTTETPFLVVNEDGTQTETRFARLCTAMEWQMLPNDPQQMGQSMMDFFGLEPGEEQLLSLFFSGYLREKEIVWTTWNFAEDVDLEFITIVKEEGLRGVQIKATAKRVYHTSCAAHLLGQVGLISAENWEEGENYKAQGYAMDATVGISGVEYAFESYLRGTSGTVQQVTDLEGTLLSESYLEAPVAGSTVALTLDIQLQEAAERALSRYTPELNQGEGGSAIVVMDVRDGGVLASASYPTYDLSDYRKNYSSLAEDPLKPLFNRAFLGTYAPGSTYKMVTATAALDTGLITPEETIDCTGRMEFLDTTFRCWIYRTNGGTHGPENVTEAIRDSCNIFFYTVGSRLGIETLTDYAQRYGLGLPTGIELSESLGVNAGPDFSDRMGMVWYPGNTLSAAIGQSDNQFTPLQLCSYVSALVNGGDRYAAHLLKSVKAADHSRMVTQYEPRLLGQVELSQESRNAILNGMGQVVDSTDSVAQAFEGLTRQGIRVGAKTGSAQVSGQENANGLFVCFAPFEDPQVAVCVAVEKGGSGAATAAIAAEVLEYYFSDEAVLERVDESNQLLR